MTAVTVALPPHLRTLAGVDGDVRLEVREEAPTTDDLLDALEARYPMLAGTIRDRTTGERRDFLRFFAAGRDVSHEPQDTRLPDAVRSGSEPFCVVGAIAGG